MRSATAISGKVSSHIRVRIDAAGQHVKSLIVTCRVIERLGFVQDIGTHAAIVEYDGKEVMVVHTMARGIWRRWTPQDRVASLSSPRSR
jgi:hypothetical protein